MKWLESSLSEVLTDARNGTWGTPPKCDGTDVPVIRSTNIHNGDLFLDDVAFRSVSKHSVRRYTLQDGDIIITTSSGSQHLIGKNALFLQPTNGGRYFFSNFTLRIRPKQFLILPRFLHLYLNSGRAKAELLRIQRTTSGLRNLNIRLYLAQKVPLPPQSEQSRIVEILDQADALIKKRAEAGAKAVCILPALFYKMFGDPATDRNGWRTVQIRDFVAPVSRRDPGNQPDTAFFYVDISGVDGQSGVIVDSKILRGSEAPSRARQVIQTNDVVISTVRPYLRATALVPAELDGQICSTGFCVLRVKDGYGFGFLYALSRLLWFTNLLNARARGASYPAVTDRDILDLQVPRHNDQQLLKTFDRQILDLLAMQDIRQIGATALDTLFASLFHRAFSGDLTAKWREAHMKELLAEMEAQARHLESSN